MLSRIAQRHADEIRNHDWCDAPWRLDRAGHNRADDHRKAPTQVLDYHETMAVRWNVAMVTLQVLQEDDPNLDFHEFALACGLPPRPYVFNSDGHPSGTITAGIRRQP